MDEQVDRTAEVEAVRAFCEEQRARSFVGTWPNPAWDAESERDPLDVAHDERGGAR